jgi:hypothetical protein
MRILARSAIFCALVGAIVACGRSSDKSAVDNANEPMTLESASKRAGIPLHYPVSAPAIEGYVGAAECATCHQKVAEAWGSSGHASAMAMPGPDTIHAPFVGDETTLQTMTIAPGSGDDQFWMDIQQGGASARMSVDLVLGAGRQHQVYLTRTPQDTYRILPIYWAPPPKVWVPTANTQKSGRDLLQVGCMKCHLSQVTYDVRAGGPKPSWGDLSINCESCHGPGKEHVEARRAGKTEPTYRDLEAISKEDEVLLCGQCHAFRQEWELDRDGVRYSPPYTLADRGFRPDGSQYTTVYQLAGHVLSECYKRGGMKCVSCHEPHDLHARDVVGNTAEAEHTDRQCSACHRDLAEPAPAQAHSHHSAKVACVDCHMAMSWVLDEETKTYQQNSDHAISIPRPEEAARFGLPNACTTCHTERTPQWALEAVTKWGQTKATGVRDWVETIYLARANTNETARLLALLADENAGEYLHASAMELLVSQERDPAAVPVLEEFARGDNAVLRGMALRALHQQAPRKSRHWLALQLADSDPVVRLSAYESVRSHSVPIDSEERFLRLFRDLVSYSRTPPFRAVADFAHGKADRVSAAEAEAPLYLAVRFTPQDELDYWSSAAAGWVNAHPSLQTIRDTGLCARGVAIACVDP